MRLIAFLLAVTIPLAAYADEIIQSFDGSGAHTTRPFKTEGAWEIQWDASGDLFQIFLYGADGSLVGVPANQMGAGTGSAYQPQGGRYYLQINAIGAWTVTVVSVE